MMFAYESSAYYKYKEDHADLAQMQINGLTNLLHMLRSVLCFAYAHLMTKFCQKRVSSPAKGPYPYGWPQPPCLQPPTPINRGVSPIFFLPLLFLGIF